MKNKYKESMLGVHHSDELTERLLEIPSKKEKSSISKKGLAGVLIAAVILSMTISVFAITQGDSIIADDITSTSSVEIASVQPTTNMTTKGVKNANNTTKVHPATTKSQQNSFLTRLDISEIEGNKNIVAIASNYKYTVFVCDNKVKTRLYVFNHIKNKFRADEELDSPQNVNYYKISIDDESTITLKTFLKDDSVIVNTYSKRLKLLSSTVDSYSDERGCAFVKMDGFEVMDDKDIGTIYNFNNDKLFYVTPYHPNFQIIGALDKKMVLGEKNNDRLVIRIKDFATKRQIARLTLTPKIDFTGKVKAYCFDDSYLTFAIGNENEDEIYVWDYNQCNMDIDIRLKTYTEQEIELEASRLANEISEKYAVDVELENISPLEKYIVTTRLNAYCEYLSEKYFDGRIDGIVFGDYDEDFVVENDIVRINARDFDKMLFYKITSQEKITTTTELTTELME